MMLFFVDDIVNVVYNNEYISIKLKDIVYQGNIVDKTKFMDEFVKMLKKEKIKGKLFGDNIYIVRNSYYNIRDIFFIESVFLELGFLKVLWMDIIDLIPNDKCSYIEINDTYMVINLDKGIFIDLNYFKDIPKILAYFSDKFQGDVVLFGNNKNIPNIKVINKNVYYFDNFKDYITESLLKVKKYGV